MKTAEQYFLATGFDPENDDLERANCVRSGEFGHDFCGWCEKHNAPRHACGKCFESAKESQHGT